MSGKFVYYFKNVSLTGKSLLEYISQEQQGKNKVPVVHEQKRLNLNKIKLLKTAVKRLIYATVYLTVVTEN